MKIRPVGYGALPRNPLAAWLSLASGRQTRQDSAFVEGATGAELFKILRLRGGPRCGTVRRLSGGLIRPGLPLDRPGTPAYVGAV